MQARRKLSAASFVFALAANAHPVLASDQSNVTLDGGQTRDSANVKDVARTERERAAVVDPVELSEISVTAKKTEANARLPLDVSSTTGSRLNITPRETAASISIIDRETIDARGVRDTLEAVTAAPGTTQHESQGSGGVLSKRGFSSSQITQMNNGIDVGYIISTKPVDSWLLNRVEVLGGASSSLYGSGAVGGAVNYVSKIATRRALRQDTLIRAGSFDSYQAAYGVNGAVGGPDTRHFVQADVSMQDSKGYVERSYTRSKVASASWLFDITPALSHTFAYEYMDKKHLPYWGTPLLNPTVNVQYDPAIRFKNYNAKDGIYEQQVKWTRSILEYRPTDSTVVTNTIYYYDADRNYRNVERYTYDTANALLIRSSAFPTRHVQSLAGDKLELVHNGELAGTSSTTSVGMDFNRNKQTRFPSPSVAVNTVDPFNFVPEDFFSIPGTLPATQPDRTNRVYTQAAYAENLTKFKPGWSLLSGLRMERIKLAVVNFRAVTAANPAYFENTYHPKTWRLGVMHDITPAANAYVTYSTAADPPAGILSTTNYGPVQNWDMTTGNQIEAGSKFDFLDGSGNATVAVYRIERKNLSTTDPNDPNVSLPIGQQSSRGFEAEVGVRLNPMWRVQGNYAHVSAQYDKFISNVGGIAVSRAGLTPTNIPSDVANLILTWDANSKLSANLGARYVSKRYGNIDNTQIFNGYQLFDASLSYKIDSHSTIMLKGRNLTDEVYIQSGSAQVIFGEPRAFDLSLRSTF